MRCGTAWRQKAVQCLPAFIGVGVRPAPSGGDVHPKVVREKLSRLFRGGVVEAFDFLLELLGYEGGDWAARDGGKAGGKGFLGAILDIGFPSGERHNEACSL